MIITTTPTIEGKPIREYKGIVSGEAIMGANIVSDRVDLRSGTMSRLGDRSMVVREDLEQLRGGKCIRRAFENSATTKPRSYLTHRRLNDVYNV